MSWFPLPFELDRRQHPVTCVLAIGLQNVSMSSNTSGPAFVRVRQVCRLVLSRSSGLTKLSTTALSEQFPRRLAEYSRRWPGGMQPSPCRQTRLSTRRTLPMTSHGDGTDRLPSRRRRSHAACPLSGHCCAMPCRAVDDLPFAEPALLLGRRFRRQIATAPPKSSQRQMRFT